MKYTIWTGAGGICLSMCLTNLFQPLEIIKPGAVYLQDSIDQFGISGIAKPGANRLRTWGIVPPETNLVGALGIAKPGARTFGITQLGVNSFRALDIAKAGAMTLAIVHPEANPSGAYRTVKPGAANFLDSITISGSYIAISGAVYCQYSIHLYKTFAIPEFETVYL